MKAISWNCQGALTVKALKELRSKYRPYLVFLMETRNEDEVMERLRKKMRYENRYYVNPEGLSGGLALWWNNEVEVKVIEAKKNCIDTLVEMEGKREGVGCVGYMQAQILMKGGISGIILKNQ